MRDEVGDLLVKVLEQGLIGLEELRQKNVDVEGLREALCHEELLGMMGDGHAFGGDQPRMARRHRRSPLGSSSQPPLGAARRICSYHHRRACLPSRRFFFKACFVTHGLFFSKISYS